MTLDESSSRLSVTNYSLVRAAEDVMYLFSIGAIFYSRLLKKNFPSKLSLKRNKVEKVSGTGLPFEDLQTVGTAD